MGTFVVQDLAGRRHVVAGRQMTIGRSRQNDLVLEAPLASRRHAWTWRQGNQEIIEDLGSTHGTWVNGQRLAGPRMLQTGDVIQMGEARLLYLAGQDPSSSDTPPQGMPRLAVTPTEPPVVRPFPAPSRSAPPRPAPATPGQVTYVPLLVMAILAVLLLVVLGSLAIYVLVFLY